LLTQLLCEKSIRRTYSAVVRTASVRAVHTIKPETSLKAIVEYMSQFRGRYLPVMDEEGNVQGLVTAFDIFQALLKSNSNTCSTGETAQALVESASPTGTT
jgi:CBS-domain-containing membrane protein